jgi:hypothetical protein
MRLLVGMILGAALLVGVAYYHDTNLVGAPGQSARPMVNWDVVNDVTRGISARVRAQFDRLTGKPERI